MKKGFTLVELLAVIIIIGVIAVITIPRVNNSLEDSKKKLAQTSAFGYKKAVEQYTLDQQINKARIYLQGEYNINNDGNLYNENIEYNIEYGGKKPKNGVLTFNENELVSGCITIEKYKIEIENGEITSVEKGTCQYTRMLTRTEKILQHAASYITAVEGLNKTESGIYSVSELNSQITYEGEKPTDGWVSLVYDATNGNWVWKYSIKYRENEVISYNGTNQTSATQIANSPIVVLIAGTNGKTAGDEIAIGTEHFYVMENTGTKIIALAKANLNVGDNKNNSLPEGIQGETGTTYAVKFSENNYWLNPDATKSPYRKIEYKDGTRTDYAYIYDPTNYAGEPGTSNYSIAYYVKNYINYLNTEYPSLDLSARILTRWENNDYGANEQLLPIISSQTSWLSTVLCQSSSQCTTVYKSSADRSNYTATVAGVRPVIEIDTSKI